MTIDPKSFEALRDAVERDLLPERLRSVAAGRGPVVVAVHRSTNGVIVRLALGQGVHVAREVVLDPNVFDLRVRLGIVEQIVVALIDAAAVRQSAAARRAPLTLGRRP